MKVLSLKHLRNCFLLTCLAGLPATSVLGAHEFFVTPVGPGSVTVVPDKPSYEDGEKVTITATPDEGCYLEFIEGRTADREGTWRTAQASTEVTISEETAGEWFAWFNTGNVIWEENFESAESDFNWTATRGEWEISTIDKTSGKEWPFEGNRVAVTDADADYPDGISTGFQYFYSILLPSVMAEDQLVLTYWHRFFMGHYDHAALRYRLLGTDEWIAGNRYHYSTPAWTRCAIDLSEFSGQEVEFELRIITVDGTSGGGDTNWGWAVDCLKVVHIPKIEPWSLEDFEHGRSSWIANNGQWEIGIPEEFIGTHSGRMVVGSTLRDYYVDSQPSTLISPSRIISDGLNRPRLSFYQWYRIGHYDHGRFGILIPNDPSVYYLGEQLNGDSGGWTSNIQEISQFGGQKIKLFFELYTEDGTSGGGDTNWGWYIDDITIFPEPASEPTFSAYYPEASFGDFYDQIEITWKDVYAFDFTTEYEVWRGTNSNINSANLIAAGLKGPIYRDTTAKIGEQYFYWAQAIRDGIPTPFTTWASGLREVGAPEDVEASQGNYPDRIRVSWPRVGGVETYEIWRKPGPSNAGGEIVQTGVYTPYFEDFTVASGRNYEYKVRSVAAGRESAWSGVAIGYRVEDAINTVSASDGLFENKVRVTWNSLLLAESYNLYRHTSRNPDQAQLLAEDLTATVFEDESANQGTVYYYWVRASRAGELTDFSNIDPGYRRLERQSDLIAWGDNSFGQTNLPDTDLTDIVAIAAGVDHSLALRGDGTVVGWGRNLHGQADPPSDLANAIDIAVGYDHSLALKSNGEVVAWGRSLFGKTAIPSMGPAIDIAAGSDHSLALQADGTIVAWGGNDYGQTDVPEGLSGVVEIAAGGFHSIARKADGTLVVWGDNTFDQLNVPARIHKALRVASGWNHCMIITPEGTVEAWGDNSEGQVSVPSTLNTGSMPNLSASIEPRDETVRVVDVSGGLFHSLALTSDGQLIAWGDDQSSQTSKPDDTGNLSQITAGEAHNVAVRGQPAPEILSIVPAYAQAEVGKDLVLRVRAKGGADMKIQWLYNGSPLPGATEDTLLLPASNPNRSGNYVARVTSGGETVDSDPVPVEAGGQSWFQHEKLGWLFPVISDWMLSSQMGYVMIRDFPWIYQSNHGWMYFFQKISDTESYYYTSEYGWILSVESTNGWFYVLDSATWLKFTD